MNSNMNSNNQNEDQMAILIRKIKKIYEHYCQFGERLNTVYMKSHKYMKLAIESDIIDQNLNRTRLELIYKSEAKSNQMDFKLFLNSLIKIAEWKYLKMKAINLDESENKQKALKILIENHFLPLYDKLFQNSIPLRSSINDQSNLNESKSMINLNQSNLVCVPLIDDIIKDPNIEEIYINVCPILYEVYRVYFPHEISLAENFEFIKENSYKQYIIFLREFELCPNFISKSAAFSIFQSEEEAESINENNQYYLRLIKNVDLNSLIRFNNKNNNILGQHFNFFKFIRVILKIAEYGYEKFENGMMETKSNLKIPNTIPNYERLILILEKMEMSEGFLNLEKKTHKTHSVRNATIISKHLLEKLQRQNKLSGQNNSLLFENNNNVNTSMINLFGTRNLEEKRQSLIYNNNYLEICELSSYIQENYGEDLLHIFKAFCSFGDQSNTKFLRTKMFTKLLMEANLINISKGQSTARDSHSNRGELGLKFNDIDTIFIKLASLQSNTTENVNNDRFVTSMTNTLPFNPVESDCSLNLSFYNANNKKKSPINSSAKIDYETFLISIEVIARLLIPDVPPKEAVEYIINAHLLKYLSDYVSKSKLSDTKIDSLRKKHNESDTAYALQMGHRALLPVFKHYADKNGSMNYEQFIRFCSDFEIFPDLISKFKLHSFFKGVCHVKTEKRDSFKTKENVGSKSIEYIEDSLFIEIIGFCAYELKFPEPEPSSVEKIIFFMEKLLHSEGTDKILRRSGSTRLTSGDSLNLLEPFKTGFPEYFYTPPPKKEEFLDVLYGRSDS